jgi:uncharacterized membrane protein YdbT with pleckstrin-like domain
MEDLLILRPNTAVPVVSTVLGWTIIVLAFIFTVKYALPEYTLLTPGVSGFIVALVLLVGVIEFTRVHRTEYRISAERIEYSESLFSERITSIPMKQVTNIVMRRDFFLDRIFGTGSIILATATQGIEIHHIENPKMSFAKMLEFQNRATPLGQEKELQQLKE